MGKRMTVVYLAFMCFFIMASQAGFSKTLDESILVGQIAVEKQTGRGDTYDIGFSGSVGSLSIDLESKKIYIAEFLAGDLAGPSVVNTAYGITSLQVYEKSIDFECVDVTPISAGLEWRGKIWLTDDGRVKVEMVMKQSSRKWVNLGKFGRQWLEKNKLNHLNLGGYSEA